MFWGNYCGKTAWVTGPENGRETAQRCHCRGTAARHQAAPVANCRPRPLISQGTHGRQSGEALRCLRRFVGNGEVVDFRLCHR